MRSRSRHGGRHELGQNFLTHRPTINRVVGLVAATKGPILEIGAGGGALTVPLARLGRELTALDIDEHRVRSLRRRLPGVTVERADILRHPLDTAVIVGNVPFHLTTPILRRLLASHDWRQAILLTQWEVARKRAGVGGSTMMTAQAAPWYEFELLGRVPAHGFCPMPSVDGGILRIGRRDSPLMPPAERRAYERFVRAIFSGRGHGLTGVVQHATGLSHRGSRGVLADAGVDGRRLPRDLGPREWAALWRSVEHRSASEAGT